MRMDGRMCGHDEYHYKQTEMNKNLCHDSFRKLFFVSNWCLLQGIFRIFNSNVHSSRGVLPTVVCPCV
jgi:hypothetical protein